MSDTVSERALALNAMQDYYADALLAYLGHPGQPGLLAARRFGEKATTAGLTVADVVGIHHAALSRLSLAATVILSAGSFLAASLSPFDEGIKALRTVNWRLDDRAGRAAHAIYDESLQLVAATHLSLDDFAVKNNSGDKSGLAEATGLLHQIEEQLSALADGLQPCIVDHLGLDAAAERLVEHFNSMTGVEVEVEASIKLPRAAPLARVVYRVIEEALTNIAVHVHANKVYIQWRQASGSVICSIRDDGAGFDDSSGLATAGERATGLISIRESIRACGGSMTVTSNSDTGTELVVVVPL